MYCFQRGFTGVAWARAHHSVSLSIDDVRCDEGLVLGIREEPRIAEQQFGNFQDVAEVCAAKEERGRFGRFWYRFPNGESGLDVFNRTTSFIAVRERCCFMLAEVRDDALIPPRRAVDTVS